MSFEFLVSCPSTIAEDIWELTGIAEDISSYSFIHHIAKEQGFQEDVLEMLGYNSWGKDCNLSPRKLFADDFALSCHKSYYQGIPCYYVQHSRIEHIFVDQEHFDLHLNEEEALSRQAELKKITEDFEIFLQHIAVAEAPLKKSVAKYFSSIQNKLIEQRITAQSVIFEAYIEHKSVRKALMTQAKRWDEAKKITFK